MTAFTGSPGDWHATGGAADLPAQLSHSSDVAATVQEMPSGGIWETIIYSVSDGTLFQKVVRDSTWFVGVAITV